MFPDPEHSPASADKSSVRVSISAPVVNELLAPKRRIRLRLGSVFRTSVPETSIHEHSNAFPGKYDVRATPNPGNNGAMKAIAHSASVELAAKCELRPGIAKADSLHPRERVRRGGGGSSLTLGALFSHGAVLARLRTTRDTSTSQNAIVGETPRSLVERVVPDRGEGSRESVHPRPRQAIETRKIETARCRRSMRRWAMHRTSG